MDKPGAKIWFKKREIGWGWTPVSPEGHWVVRLFLALVVLGAGLGVFAVSAGADKSIVTRSLMGWSLFLSLAVIWIANRKGEK